MTRKLPKPKERQTRIEANRKERKERRKQLERIKAEWNRGNRTTRDSE